jgi:hypothetical protein
MMAGNGFNRPTEELKGEIMIAELPFFQRLSGRWGR